MLPRPLEQCYAVQVDTGANRSERGDAGTRRACGVAEAAEYLGISPSSVRALIAADKLAARRFGPKVLIEYSELDAFFDALPEAD